MLMRRVNKQKYEEKWGTNALERLSRRAQQDGDYLIVSADHWSQCMSINKRTPTQKALNVIRQTTHAGKQVALTAMGVGMANRTVASERMAICRSCPEAYPSDEPIACGPTAKALGRSVNDPTPCGCFLKQKVVRQDEKCPLNKW